MQHRSKELHNKRPTDQASALGLYLARHGPSKPYPLQGKAVDMALYLRYNAHIANGLRCRASTSGAVK